MVLESLLLSDNADNVNSHQPALQACSVKHKVRNYVHGHVNNNCSSAGPTTLTPAAI